MNLTTSIQIVLLGCGSVGSTLADLVSKGSLPGFSIKKIVVVNLGKARLAEVRDQAARQPLVLPLSLLTTDGETAVLDPRTDIVVDATAADTTNLLLRAIAAGKHVVTANKKFVARDGARLKSAAQAAGVQFRCEATVVAKVPVLAAARTVRHLNPQGFDGVISGTCAFILRMMRVEAADFTSALTEAQERGFAEADPTTDIDAHDAAAKARILAHEFLRADALCPEAEPLVLREGIRGLPDFAHRFAASTGRVVELVASGVLVGGEVGMLVLPTLVPRTSFLGGLRGVENGIVTQDLIGPPLEFAGPGAGGLATAAAIAMDLVAIRQQISSASAEDAMTIRPLLAPSHLRFRALFLSASPESKQGVFADKLRVLAEAGLSVEQLGNDPGGTWPEYGETFSFDAIACEAADFGTIENARMGLQELGCVKGKVFLLRILGDEPLAFAQVAH